MAIIERGPNLIREMPYKKCRECGRMAFWTQALDDPLRIVELVYLCKKHAAEAWGRDMDGDYVYRPIPVVVRRPD